MIRYREETKNADGHVVSTTPLYFPHESARADWFRQNGYEQADPKNGDYSYVKDHGGGLVSRAVAVDENGNPIVK